jgi:hypothetical protein
MTALIKELSPQARVETLLSGKKKKTRIFTSIRRSQSIPKEAARIDLKREIVANHVLEKIGLFIIGTVCD